MPAICWYIVGGGAVALFIRPDEIVLLVIGFAVAMVVRGLFRQGRSFRNPIRIAAAVVVIGAFVVLTGIEASHFIHEAGGNGLTGSLSQVQANNQGVGAGFGSSQVPYSSNPLYYPGDVYTVLFDPLPIAARSVTTLAAAAENTLILVLFFLSFRQLRCLFHVSLQRPYVLVCAVYNVVFLYSSAALGNLGLITRERSLLLPFLFVLLAIPLAPVGEYPYPWQLARRLRHPTGDAAGGARWTQRTAANRPWTRPWSPTSVLTQPRIQETADSSAASGLYKQSRTCQELPPTPCNSPTSLSGVRPHSPFVCTTCQRLVGRCADGSRML